MANTTKCKTTTS